MFDVIFSPQKAIAEAKKKSTGYVWGKLIVASIIVGIFGLIYGLKLGLTFGNAVMFLIGTMIAALIGTIFNGWVYGLVINILSNKGTFTQMLHSLTNGLLISGTGLVVATLLLTLSQHQIVMMLALLVIIIMFVISYAVTIKSITTLTGTDLLTVVVTLGIIFFASVVAVYFLMTFAMTAYFGAMNPGVLAAY